MLYYNILSILENASLSMLDACFFFVFFLVPVLDFFFQIIWTIFLLIFTKYLDLENKPLNQSTVENSINKFFMRKWLWLITCYRRLLTNMKEIDNLRYEKYSKISQRIFSWERNFQNHLTFYPQWAIIFPLRLQIQNST